MTVQLASWAQRTHEACNSSWTSLTPWTIKVSASALAAATLLVSAVLLSATSARAACTCFPCADCFIQNRGQLNFVVFDRDTGQPLHNAIVWLDTRTADIVKSLSDKHGEQGLE